MADSQSIDVRIDWQSDEESPAYAANQVVVSFDGANYVIRFYQALPSVDLLLRPEAQTEPVVVKGKHLITLVVAEKAMPGIVRAFVDTEQRVGEDESV